MSEAAVWRGLVVIGLIPLVWSGVVFTARVAGRSSRREPLDDGTEKIALTLMAAPVFAGAVLLIIARLAPGQMAALPLPDLMAVETPGGLATSAADSRSVNATGAGSAPIAYSLLFVYALGLVAMLTRLACARARLGRIAQRARPASEWDDDVLATPEPTPPFTLGRRRIVAPERLLQALPPQQIALILAHERAHERRGDPFHFAALAVIDAVFWFNPFMRAQTQRCRVAAEVATDAAVTRDAPHMRKAYALTLVAALKHTAGDARPCAPAVF